MVLAGLYNRYYQPVLERILEPARAILLLELDGVYTITGITPTPLPFDYPITHTLARKHYTLPRVYPPAVRYKRSGETIALELLVDTSQVYTVSWEYNGVPQSPITIPALPNPPNMIYQRTPIYPFAHNHLAGYLYEQRVVGNYQSGGMPVAIPTTHSGIITVVCVPLGTTNYLFSAFQVNNEWRIIIRNPNGSELPNGTPVDTWVRVYVWAHYR